MPSTQRSARSRWRGVAWARARHDPSVPFRVTVQPRLVATEPSPLRRDVGAGLQRLVSRQLHRDRLDVDDGAIALGVERSYAAWVRAETGQLRGSAGAAAGLRVPLREV